MTIRNETKDDYRKVEELTREAFWNVQVPGCDEHYLVHTMRKHEDFIPELSFVLEENGKIVANVMYTKSKLIDEEGKVKNIVTFGPISVDPTKQRKGYGRKILEHSFEKALEMGFDTIVILGSPHNYFSYGFKNAIRYNIKMNGVVPVGLLVKELIPGALDGKKWNFIESSVYHVDESKVEEFDRTFPPKKKEYCYTQEFFYTFVRSRVISEE